MRTVRLFAAILGIVAVGGLMPACAQGEPSPKLEMVGHLPLPGPRGHIWAHKNVVYIGGAFDSLVGVALIDIADPAKPTFLGNLPGKPNSRYEDVMVISADTPAFTGDLLAVGLQFGAPGVEFWNVTDPRQPQLLGSFRGSRVPELYVLQRQGQILALMATAGGGLRIVDATDPRQPKLLGAWNLQTELKISPSLGSAFRDSRDFSVSANAEGTRAYISYLDAGAVILDISDPAQPRFLGRTVYPLTEEGDTYRTVDADGGRLLVTTDYDLDPTPVAHSIRITTPSSLAGLHQAIEVSAGRQLVETGAIRGEVVYVGSGTPGTDYLRDPKGRIALVDTPMTAAVLLRAQEAGAVAVLSSGLRRAGGKPDTRLTIPGVSLKTETAEAIKGALAVGEKVAVELAAGAATWGFVRLWDIRDQANPVQVGSFATAHTRQFPPPPQGEFWANNTPSVRGSRLYVPWVTDGVRVVDIADPAQPREIGHFVPPVQPIPFVAGAVEHNGLILIADLASGLWIVRDLLR